jgi:hypothetical protein
MNSSDTFAKNQPFGKPSPRIIEEKWLKLLPLHSDVCCSYLHYASLVLAAPIQFHGLVCLTTLMFEAARRGYSFDDPIRMGLWTCLVGDSGTGKSTCIDLGTQMLLDLWDHQEIEFEQAVDPLVQCDDSTTSALLVDLHRHFEVTRGTTVALVYAYQVQRLFRERDCPYPILCNLFDGRTHAQSRREYQRQRGNNARQASDGVPDRIITPTLSALFDTSADALTDLLGKSALNSGFLNRVLLVHGASDPTLYTRTQPQLYENERLDSLDGFDLWSCQLPMNVPDKIFRYSPEVIEKYNDLAQTFLTKQLNEKKQVLERAYRVAGGYAVVEPTPIITLEHFDQAYALTTELNKSSKRIGESIGSSDTARQADQAEAILLERKGKGISLAKLLRRLKISRTEYEAVIQTLEAREALRKVNDARPGSVGKRMVYYHPTFTYQRKYPDNQEPT